MNKNIMKRPNIARVEAAGLQFMGRVARRYTIGLFIFYLFIIYLQFIYLFMPLVGTLTGYLTITKLNTKGRKVIVSLINSLGELISHRCCYQQSMALE